MKKRKQTSPKRTAILVCVTGQKDCDRLIRTGRKLADSHETELQVLCVQPAAAGLGTVEASEELEYLRQTARNAEAALIAVGFIKQVGAIHVVTGMAEVPINGFVDTIHRMIPSVPISMVSKEGVIYNICPDSADCGPQLQTVPEQA